MSHYIKTTFVDSNGFQVLAVIGRPLKDLAKAVNQAQKISLNRGVAEVVDQHNHVLAAFRSGTKIEGSVLQ